MHSRRPRLTRTLATLSSVGVLAALAVTASPATSAVAAARQAAGGQLHVCLGKVAKVKDGDTVNVRLTTPCPGGHKGQIMPVRNAAIQATEMHGTGGHPECWARAAAKFFHREMPHGSVVRLLSYGAIKSNERDGHGRIRFIKYMDVQSIANGVTSWTDVQRPEIRAGLAMYKAENVEQARVVSYAKAEQAAMHQHLGMWGDASHCSSRYQPTAKLKAWTVWKTDGPDSRGTANQEAFKVRNTSPFAVNLSHWRVRDASHFLYEGRTTYLTLPAGTMLPSGHTLTIRPGNGSDNPGRDVFYLRSRQLPMFANAPMPHPAAGNPSGYGEHLTSSVPGTSLFLLDPALDFRAWSVYPCLTTCGAPPQLKITKVHYKRTRHQSVVIKNIGGRTASLTGVVFDANGHTRSLDPWAHLSPGQKMVLHVQGHKRDSRQAEYWGHTSHLLSVAGETVWLRTASDVTIDIHRWGNSGRYNYYR